MGKESGKEWICVSLNHFPIHLKQIQHCKSNILQYKINTCIHIYINKKYLIYRSKNQSQFEVLPYVPDGNEKIPDHPCLLGIFDLLGGKLTYRESYQ